MELKLTFNELELLLKIFQDSYWKRQMNPTENPDLEKLWKKLEDYRIDLLKDKYETKKDVEK